MTNASVRGLAAKFGTVMIGTAATAALGVLVLGIWGDRCQLWRSTTTAYRTAAVAACGRFVKTDQSELCTCALLCKLASDQPHEATFHHAPSQVADAQCSKERSTSRQQVCNDIWMPGISALGGRTSCTQAKTPQSPLNHFSADATSRTLETQAKSKDLVGEVKLGGPGQTAGTAEPCSCRCAQ